MPGRTSAFYTNFSSGELSPLMRGRTDFQRYQRGAHTIENAVVLLQGGLRKRYGTRHVASAGVPDQPVRLMPFIFRSVDALVLEWGQAYVRFFKQGAQVGAPYQLATPYQAVDVFALRPAQKNDVVYLAHQGYAPRKLLRSSDTSWQLQTMMPNPPPTYEAGRKPSIALTLSATSGSAVTATAATAAFLASDVDREVTSGGGRGIITSYTSTTVVTMRVVDTFPSTVLMAGTWTLQGSPNAILKPSDVGPNGTTITLVLRKVQPGATNLVANGDFATADLTSWSNVSNGLLASGAHDGANASDVLIDSTASFLTAGVQTTQIVANVTDGSQGVVSAISATRITAQLSGGVDAKWDTSDVYEISGTGSANASTGAAVLQGGSAGEGAIAQELTTLAGVTYRLTFTVALASLSCLVGSSAAETSNLFAEASFPLGSDSAVIFTATGISTWVTFRNNQQGPASVDNVSCAIYGIDGWRAEDVGAYVYLHGGLVQITSVTSAQVASATVLATLTTDDEAPAGAWTLERESWSAINGYPLAMRFHEQRLLAQSSPQFPQTVWGSRSDDFENFTRGTLASDAFEYTLADAQGLLYWLLSGEQLILGAENRPFRMVGQNDGPLVANSVPLVRPVAEEIGAGALEALRVGEFVLYGERNGASLQEFSFLQAIQRADAKDLTALSGHLLDRTRHLAQLGYDGHALLPLVLGVRSDGELLGLTYKRTEDVAAWHRHVLGGAGLVESMAVIPHPTENGNQTWLVVNRGGMRAIEVQDERIFGVDAAVYYDGAATAILTGLAHLEGQSVRAYGIPSGGVSWAAFPAQVVTGGQITLPVACTPMYAGLPYTMVVETLPAELAGVPTFQVKPQTWNPVSLRLLQTAAGLRMGMADVGITRVPMPGGVAMLGDGVPWYTGDVTFPNPGWSRAGRLRIEHGEPGPCTILMAGGDIGFGDN